MSATHLNSFLLKITNRCNFKCSRCYFRHQADQSYKSRPKDMGLDLVALFAERLGEYAHTRKLAAINIIFHGGEPLLLGPQYLDEATQIISRRLPPDCKPIFSLQSNGSLLNQEIIDTLRRSKISVSISLDGNRSAQDRHRVFADGSSSFDVVVRNIKTLLHDSIAEDLFSGILAVVDLRDDPLQTFDFLASMTTSGVDFLFPDGTHENPPPGITTHNFKVNSDYAKWLIPIFDKWFARGVRKPSIRLFENILTLILGGRSNVEGLGEQCLSLLTIETDGEIRDSDILSVAYEHAARFGRGAYLESDSLVNLIDSAAFRAQQTLYLPTSLSVDCQACCWCTICGGGLLPHRFSGQKQFNNPSIYCGNLKSIFAHVRAKLLSLMPPGHTISGESNVTIDSVNRMDQVSDYLRKWDFSLDSYDKNLQIVKGPNGNISESGKVDEPIAASLTPAHPMFFDCIEKDIRDLVTILIEDMDCITYSSCQGHQRLDGSLIRPRNVGILCRDETEQLSLTDFLKSVVTSSEADQPSILNDWLESGNDLYRTVEIVFECDSSRSETYWATIEKRYNHFVQYLKRASSLNYKFEMDISVKATKQISNELKSILCDCKYSSISLKHGKLAVKDCRPFYRNEALSLLHQARRRTGSAIVNNHAWGLLSWVLSAAQLLNSNPVAGIHLIHIDYHSDLASPRLYSRGRERTLVDYFTRESVDLWDSDSVAKAIRSTAIGPGSFILPFLYANRERKCKIDLIVPSSPSYDGDKFNGSGWSIGIDGPPLPGIPDKTLRLEPCPSDRQGNLKIACRPISDVQLEVDFDRYIVILDIDFDFFSNRLAGSSDWSASPGWHPDFKTRSVLFEQVEDLLGEILAKGTPHATTLAISPDFCPKSIRFEVFNRLDSFFSKTGQGS
ncbi:MAG: radical SAM protein [Syntrophobacteraceae bacterium]